MSFVKRGDGEVRVRLTGKIDDPYSLEQLRDPRLNVSVVRPLVDKLYDLDDLSVGMLLFSYSYSHQTTLNFGGMDVSTFPSDENKQQKKFGKC